jgi:P-type E1-E2 ATPase
VLYSNKEYKFKILRVVEFNSDRKRMTVVVESKGVVFTFVKGADSVLRGLLSHLEFIESKTKEMSKTGLRSLWFAYKMMPNQASYETTPVPELESDLTLLGATGIEDQLQDYVPETIHSLKQGGIN